MAPQPMEQDHGRVTSRTPIEIVEFQTIGRNGLVLRLYL